jgi:phage FluMu gp28-like protein
MASERKNAARVPQRAGPAGPAGATTAPGEREESAALQPAALPPQQAKGRLAGDPGLESRATDAGATAARVNLYPYQKAWITDESRFKFFVKGRQTGLSFGTSFRHVRKRVKTKATTVWVSASQRQSKEAIEYVQLHSRAVRQIFDYEQIEFPGTDDKAEQVTFRHNGARIVALPANPDTMRGYSGDVVLDEFAFHRDPYKIWRAAMAIASRGYQVEVISTPNGQRGKYWDVARECGVPADGMVERAQWTHGVWSVHHLTIQEAVKQGCPIDIEAMHAAAGDEDTWLQEYGCVFLADAENYIPMELIIAAESDGASLELPLGFIPLGELYLGWDIGRKKDRTVVWLLERLGDVLWTRTVIVLVRTPFREQFELIDSLICPRSPKAGDPGTPWPGVHRACGDATGIGAQIGEDLVRKYGAKVEAVEFNIANKEAMATATKRRFEDRTVRIPAANHIRFACNAVKRFTSPTGHFRFDAERTEQGHADEFWALALACAAAEHAAGGIVDFWKQEAKTYHRDTETQRKALGIGDFGLGNLEAATASRIGTYDGSRNPESSISNP